MDFYYDCFTVKLCIIKVNITYLGQEYTKNFQDFLVHHLANFYIFVMNEFYHIIQVIHSFVGQYNDQFKNAINFIALKLSPLKPYADEFFEKYVDTFLWILKKIITTVLIV
jgi:hypothetical protein